MWLPLVVEAAVAGPPKMPLLPVAVVGVVIHTHF
jgi:hypothetical protein